MKNLLLFTIAFCLLIFTSCTKEEITSPDTKASDALIIDDTPNFVDATIETISEGSGEGFLSNGDPTALKSALEYLETENDLSIFYDAIMRTGMDNAINEKGPYTIFAPTNKAFENYLAMHDVNSIDFISIPDLTKIVQFHISASGVMVNSSGSEIAVPILFGDFNLYIYTDSAPKHVTLGWTSANFIDTDIEQSNGRVNKIDAVLYL